MNAPRAEAVRANATGQRRASAAVLVLRISFPDFAERR